MQERELELELRLKRMGNQEGGLRGDVSFFFFFFFGLSITFDS